MSRARCMRSVRVRVLGVAVLAALAACGNGASGSGSAAGRGQVIGGPGVDTTAKTITLGVLTSLSGPLGVIGKPLTLGEETYFKKVDDSGGIDGYRVDLVEKDDQNNPQLHVQLYNEIVPDVAFIAQSLGGSTTRAIQDLADRGKVVIGAATQSSSWVTDQVMAVIGTPDAVDVANGVDYIVKTLGKANARIGIIYQKDDYGLDGLKGYQKAVDTYHVNDVDRETYNAGDKDFTAQVTNLRKKGAEYVFVVAMPAAAAAIVGSASAIRFTPQWMLQGPAWSETLMTTDGTATGTRTPIYAALAGTASVLGYLAQWGDTSVPGMAQFLADHDKYAAAQPPDRSFEYGYCLAEVEAAVITSALESGDLSRNGLLNAKLHLGSVDFGGLIPPVNYSPSLGPASVTTNISRIDPGEPGFLKVIQPAFEGEAAKALSL